MRLMWCCVPAVPCCVPRVGAPPPHPGHSPPSSSPSTVHPSGGPKTSARVPWVRNARPHSARLPGAAASSPARHPRSPPRCCVLGGPRPQRHGSKWPQVAAGVLIREDARGPGSHGPSPAAETALGLWEEGGKEPEGRPGRVEARRGRCDTLVTSAQVTVSLGHPDPAATTGTPIPGHGNVGHLVPHQEDPEPTGGEGRGAPGLEMTGCLRPRFSPSPVWGEEQRKPLGAACRAGRPRGRGAGLRGCTPRAEGPEPAA